MPKNLTAKISYLLEDTQRLSQADRIRAIEAFVQQELAFTQSEHLIPVHNLQQIESRAATISRDLPGDLEMDGKRIAEYPNLYRTLCYVQATYEYMRAEKLTPCLMGFKSRRQS